MNLQTSITNLANYNLWVNQQYVNWLSAKTEEQLNHEVPSSFSSLLKTLNHIWAIEAYWFSLITQQADVEDRYGVEDLKAAEVFEGLINRSTQLADAIKSLTEADLQEQIKVVAPWFEANLSRAEYLQHLVNHSTYHRGQIVTIGRNAGLTDAPMTDYLFYSISTAQQ